MTLVSDFTKCPQCGFAGADYQFDCDTDEAAIDCRMCGHSEVVERVEDADGKVTWRHTVTEGSGALFYRAHDSGAFVARYLSSEEDLLWTEKWLRKELEAGGVHAESAYLTRWNSEAKVVEFVIGSFYEYPSDSNA